MSLLNFLFGRPLATSEGQGEKIGPGRGIGVFGMDALGSAVYGPEAALTMMIPLGMAGVIQLVPVTMAIVILTALVYFSYNQTISTYPGSGGAFTVASQNLGTWPGLIAAASLMIDYVLVVAVGIASGVGTIISVLPFLQHHVTVLCLFILLIITTINLRGTGDTGAVFLIPAYLFILSLLIVLGIGVYKTLITGGSPQPMVNPPELKNAGAAISIWIWMRAFSNGCTAMTGVEAVSNGVPTFREPAVRNARITLAVIMGVLMLMLVLIAWMCKVYSVGATQPGSDEYRSVLYLLVNAVIGNSWYSYIPIISIMLIVIFQANTSFTGFPRLCSVIARQRFLPHVFANVGRRLVYSTGIIVLAVLSAILLIAFQGVTDKLIPLFALGAFTAYTLSQAGMVMHWKKNKGKHWVKSIIISSIGMIGTGLTTLVVLVTKFTEGAWIVVLLIPAILFFMKNVYSHYLNVEKQLFIASPVGSREKSIPVVIIPFEEWNNNTRKSLEYGLNLTTDIILLHVSTDKEDEDRTRRDWRDYVELPLNESGRKIPRLEIFNSEYRYVVAPIVDFVLDFEKKNPSRQLALIIPMLVERKWYHRFLHNQRGLLLMGLLFAKGSTRTAVIHVPWYLKKEVPVNPALKNNETVIPDQNIQGKQ